MNTIEISPSSPKRRRVRSQEPCWAYQVRLQGRTISHAFPVERLRAVWAELASVQDRHGVEPTLMLAIALVETALSEGTDHPIRLFPAPVAHRLLVDQPFGTILTPDFAAGHLAVQLHRFDRQLPLALLAYHTDPGYVTANAERALGDARHAGYVQAVMSTLSWLGETQPWQVWPHMAQEEQRETPVPRHWKRPPKPPSPRERVFNLLGELDELIPLGYHHYHPMSEAGALLKAALPSGWPCLKRILDGLSAPDRTLLYLLAYGRMSRQEAARSLGTTLTAVNKRVGRLANRFIQGGFTV